LEINNINPSTELLNQNTNGYPERLEEQTPSSPDISENEMTDNATKQAAVKKSLDNQLAKPPVQEKVSPKNKVQGQSQLMKQSQSTVDSSKSKLATAATQPAIINKSNDKLQTKTPVLETKKPSEVTVKKVLAEKKATNTQNAAGWSVNLTAFEDLNYAKAKAAKLLQKGIPVKVIPVDMNNTTWYRLKVGGFKNKEEATAYADKIKRSLNLNSISVVNN